MRNKKLESKQLAGRNVFTFSSDSYRILISHPIAIGFLFLILFSSCSIQKKISRSANLVIKDSSLQTAHIGISIYEPGTGKYWYNYQGDKYFVPASNTKIPTCYAAMKYLGDSLVGLRYTETNDSLYITPSGDPSFMLKEFKANPVMHFLSGKNKPIVINNANWNDERFGAGWNWGDYTEYYMPERSPMPVNGNVIDWMVAKVPHAAILKDTSYDPGYTVVVLNTPEIGEFEVTDINESTTEIVRNEQSNFFNIKIKKGPQLVYTTQKPFITDTLAITGKILSDTLKIPVSVRNFKQDKSATIIHSQPVDSLLRPMMHRSDNFFAEQSLLMVSNERLGVMSDEKIIDTLLKTDFKDLPQKPRWVDGCGLSRYNLFTPQDFVFILHKMQQEFGMDRVKNILATGGEGTLSSYYKAEKGYIYAKTGSLSGVLCLSGFLYTKKNKLLIFSVLVNNYRSAPSDVRKAVEKFLESTRNRF